MNLTFLQQEVYDYTDIELYIRDKLDSDNLKTIREFESNFWDVWLELNCNNVHKDTSTQVWFDMLIDGIDDVKEDFGDWVEDLRPAFIELQKDVGNTDYIIVHYSW